MMDMREMVHYSEVVHIRLSTVGKLYSLVYMNAVQLWSIPLLGAKLLD